MIMKTICFKLMQPRIGSRLVEAALLISKKALKRASSLERIAGVGHRGMKMWKRKKKG